MGLTTSAPSCLSSAGAAQVAGRGRTVDPGARPGHLARRLRDLRDRVPASAGDEAAMLHHQRDIVLDPQHEPVAQPIHGTTGGPS
jgi:hypothetical protein